jgi:amino acid transporter
MISVAILVILFSVQRFGTDKVGYTFAPAILVWYICIGTVGIFNLIQHDPTVLKAFNPIYIVSYFRSDLKEAWISLGGVVLCMTGMIFSLLMFFFSFEEILSVNVHMLFSCVRKHPLGYHINSVRVNYRTQRNTTW